MFINSLSRTTALKNDGTDPGQGLVTPRGERLAGLPAQREELLLKAALLPVPAATDAWKAWVGSVDIERDLSPAEDRLLPLAYHNLTASTARARPDFNSMTVERYKKTLYCNNQLLHNLLQVVDMLKSIDVQPIVLKGAALILSGTYDKIGTRVLTDYDLLVPFDRKEEVLGFLAHKGFKPADRWSWYREPFRQVHSIELESAQFGALDLHWLPIAVNKDEKVATAFFAHKESLSTAGRELFVTVPELQLIQAVAHGLRNEPAGRTQWVCDAVKLIERYPSMDWVKVARLAADLGAGPFIQNGLEYLAGAFERWIQERWLSTAREMRISPDERRVFLAWNKPYVGMRDLFFLKVYDLQQHAPGRSPIYYWWTLFHDWRHAAHASRNGSVARELVTAVRHFLGNTPYDMGGYRKQR